MRLFNSELMNPFSMCVHAHLRSWTESRAAHPARLNRKRLRITIANAEISRIVSVHVFSPKRYEETFISEVTLAFFEDSGWYQPNYAMANASAVGFRVPEHAPVMATSGRINRFRLAR